MENVNKKKLDELLGIVSDLQSKPAEPIQKPKPESVIPDDLPRDEETLDPKDEPNERESSDLMKSDPTAVGEVKRSLTEIDSLLELSKQVMQHVYSVVTSSDILDPSTIAAAASLIKETRGLVQEHLKIQETQRDFLNQVQMEEIKHQHQIELMEKKFELEQLKFRNQNPAVNTKGSSNNPKPAGNEMKKYSSSDLMRMLDKDE